METGESDIPRGGTLWGRDCAKVGSWVRLWGLVGPTLELKGLWDGGAGRGSQGQNIEGCKPSKRQPRGKETRCPCTLQEVIYFACCEGKWAPARFFSSSLGTVLGEGRWDKRVQKSFHSTVVSS